MRLSAIQKDVLFVLRAIEHQGHSGPVPGMRLLTMVNSARSSEVYATNFRTSCHTLMDHGLLQRYRDPSLKLAWALTDKGREHGERIYLQRINEQ